jgi:uncharacterized spore protein YtfJ
VSEQETLDPATAGALPADRAAGLVEKLISAADVSRVFGEPIRNGDTLLIPAAEILTMAGFGMGSGGGINADSRGRPRRGEGGGGGGGGRTLARSVAVIVASSDGVRVKPIFDVTKIALAALTAAGFVWASWRGMSRPKRFLKN